MDAVITTPHVARKAVWGGIVRLTGAVALTTLAAGCGDMTRQGTGSSYLVITSIEAASGAEPGEFGTTLGSDVVTVVDGVPTVFSDAGQVTFALAMKDPLLSPTSANTITINRYHVRYIRADGRNTPGVDVPYPFDGAFTISVTDEASGGFELVRIQAKAEAPLAALARNFLAISTIAEVTFYGRDQTGREVSVSGNISVNFANFGDPN